MYYLVPYLLKTQDRSSMVMVTKRTIMATMFTIAIASSLVAVSGLISSAHAISAKKQTEYGTAPQVSLAKDKSSSTKPQNTNVHRIQSLALGNPDAVAEKQVKSLSKCENTAAVDGDLTPADVKVCYHKVF
jgi:3-keto-L-gulonate-6-phosphate decarboxylase